MDTVTLILDYLEERFAVSAKNIRVTGDTPLLEAKVIDSFGMLELVFFIEETFGVEVPDEDITPVNFSTVNKLAAYIDAMLVPEQ
jgi:acyl carrier protein